MDLVDEQHVVWFEVGEQRRQIAGLLQHRAGSGLDIDPHLVGHDVGQRGLAKPRRAEDQQVIERLATLARRRDEDLHLLADGILTGVIGQQLGPDGPIDDFLFSPAGGGDETIRFNHCLPHTRLRSASRMISSTDMPSTATLLTI